MKLKTLTIKIEPLNIGGKPRKKTGTGVVLACKMCNQKRGNLPFSVYKLKNV